MKPSQSIPPNQPENTQTSTTALVPQVFTRPNVRSPFLTGMIVRQFGQQLIDRAVQTPYFHLEDYMQRFWLLKPASKRGTAPKGLFKQVRDLGIRIHCIMRSDRDGALHDHPWLNISVILKGCYWEVIPLGNRSPNRLPRHAVLIEDPNHEPAYAVFRPEGSVIIRGPKTRHRLVVNLDDLNGEPGVWTMFITFGKGKGNDWGFYKPDASDNRITRWIAWWDYIGVSKEGNDPGPGAVIKARPSEAPAEQGTSS